MITKLLEDSESTKKIQKHLNIETNLTTYLINENNQKMYNRSHINKIATKFFSMLYKINNKSLKARTQPNHGNDEQKFLDSEIKTIV